jgi:hypothetical protein
MAVASPAANTDKPISTATGMARWSTLSTHFKNFMGSKRSQDLGVPLVSPLNELARSSPSEVISRYSISAVNEGSTHVALGILIGFVSLD